MLHADEFTIRYSLYLPRKQLSLSYFAILYANEVSLFVDFH